MSATARALPNPEFWRGRRVLITGATGFKGSWLSLWLSRLEAKVSGYALPAPTEPSLFERAQLGDVVDWINADVRSLPALTRAFSETRPEIVIHLAAQPIV